MGIITQTWMSGSHTNLNTLTFDEYSHTSGKPLITHKIPAKGGDPSPSTNGEIARRVNDLVRIGKLLITPPGLKYLRNETALNVQQVKFKQRIKKKGKNAGKVDILGTALNAIGANLFNTVKIIGSTLAQVPLNGTGTHFVKAFKAKGKNTYLNNLPTAAHKLALYNGRVFEDTIAPNVSGRPDPSIERQPEDDAFMTDSVLGLLQSVYAPDRESDNTQFPTVFTPSDIRKETRIGLGDQGLVTGKSKTSYWVKNDTTMEDRVNMLPPSSESVKKDENKDLIKFHFQVITPRGDHWLYFRAYLDSFNDSFSGQWNSVKYLARAENFYTYEGFDRGIDLGFKIAASSRQEMRPLYQKINALASATAPAYTTMGHLTPTFVNVTVGDYLNSVPCLIESVGYQWQQDYGWEIGLNDPAAQDEGNFEKDADFDQQELPMILDCSLKIKPLHTFIPQTGALPFIGNSRKSDKRLFTNENNGLDNKYKPAVKLT